MHAHHIGIAPQRNAAGQADLVAWVLSLLGQAFDCILTGAAGGGPEVAGDTARCMVPSIPFHLSPSHHRTALVEVSCNQSITSTSNSAVTPEPGSAQGTSICLTPCSGGSTRGTSAARMVRNWHVSR